MWHEIWKLLGRGNSRGREGGKVGEVVIKSRSCLIGALYSRETVCSNTERNAAVVYSSRLNSLNFPEVRPSPSRPMRIRRLPGPHYHRLRDAGRISVTHDRVLSSSLAIAIAHSCATEHAEVIAQSGEALTEYCGGPRVSWSARTPCIDDEPRINTRAKSATEKHHSIESLSSEH